MKTKLAAITVSLAFAASSQAQMLITEWMYSGGDGEFIEFTNIGGSAIDMTGWSFDDSTPVAGTIDLSAFGVVAAGESVILTESPEAEFRAAWGLGGGIAIIGDLGGTSNLGRGDEINLFDNSDSLVDRLTYGDEVFPGTIRTQNFSGWATVTIPDTNDVSTWVLSSVGDAQGSFLSMGGDTGNPGSYSAIPEPGTYAAFIGLSALAFAAFRRRQRRLASKAS